MEDAIQVHAKTIQQMEEDPAKMMLEEMLNVIREQGKRWKMMEERKRKVSGRHLSLL